MNAAEIKESIHHLIDQVQDEELLKAYLNVIEKGIEGFDQTNNVGYTIHGHPLSMEEVIAQVAAASLRVKSGSFISQEDLEKTSDNW